MAGKVWWLLFLLGAVVYSATAYDRGYDDGLTAANKAWCRNMIKVGPDDGFCSEHLSRK